MTNETGSVWVTFNGEIYNYPELRRELAGRGHSFRSHSDTEAVIHGYEEWGTEGLFTRLRGMFAFALYDREAMVREDGGPFVILARDRLGIKPLYYVRDSDRVAFASEVKALRRSGVRRGGVNQDAMIGFLCLGSIPAPLTCFEDIQCLEPGHYLTVSRSGIKKHKYWDLSFDTPGERMGLAEELASAVEQHLVSDVPLGVFLSGGVDSAGVAAIASRKVERPLFTLTVTFKEQEFNEGVAAREVAQTLGTNHHEVPVSDANFLEEIPRILDAMDQPTADGVNTYFVSQAARKLGFTVVLSGLGGDEVFFGYPHYRRLAAVNGSLRRLAAMPDVVRDFFAHGAEAYGQLAGQERWERFAFLREHSLSHGLYLLMRGFYSPRQAAELLGTSVADVHNAIEKTFAGLMPPRGVEESNQFNYLEMKRYLHDQLLRDSDVFSMAHSIELRVPFLDHRVVELGAAIPVGDKVSAAMNKPKLVEAIGHPAVERVARLPKRGFTFPFSKWMLKHADVLEARALETTVLDRAAVRKHWKEFRAGRLHWSRAWATVAVGTIARN